VRFLLLFSVSFFVELEERFSAYIAALNRPDVESALSMIAPGLRDRDLVEWGASMQARSEPEIVSIRGDWLTARIVEESLLNAALEARRSRVSAYRFENGVIREIRILETREDRRSRYRSRARARFPRPVEAPGSGLTAPSGSVHQAGTPFQPGNGPISTRWPVADVGSETTRRLVKPRMRSRISS
jgi:hypothetical protein